MKDVKSQQIEWVRAVMAHLGLTSANQLALRVGTNPANIQKPMNPNYPGKFGIDTLQKIAKAAGVPVMQFPGGAGEHGSTEAEHFSTGELSGAIASNVDRAVRELCMGRNGRDAWVMRSHALEMAGILPGDILIVDQNLTPRAKDIVCAQAQRWGAAQPDLMFRIYEPPFLLTSSMRLGSSRPVTVDGEAVTIRGVVDAVLRRRH